MHYYHIVTTYPDADNKAAYFRSEDGDFAWTIMYWDERATWLFSTMQGFQDILNNVHCVVDEITEADWQRLVASIGENYIDVQNTNR